VGKAQKRVQTYQDPHGQELLIAMMYQPWELCDELFARWGEINKITLPAKNTMRTVATEHLYSA